LSAGRKFSKKNITAVKNKLAGTQKKITPDKVCSMTKKVNGTGNQ
jgi:hypothetical protein